MAKVNVPVVNTNKTHEGAPASMINAEQELRRSLMSCLLWEDTHYESGESVAERIVSLIPKVDPEKVAAMAIEARNKQHLRHAPLLVLREMARHPKHKALVGDTLPEVIQRADELGEFLALYWKDKRQPLSGQVKKGIARAFPKFNEYELAKYNRDEKVKLRDALFLSHAKPQNAEQADLWKRLIDDKLEVPNTWEVRLSAAKNASKEEKKAIWEDLLKSKALGGLAFLRNLRNMTEAGVTPELINEYVDVVNVSRVLPFRFIAAAKAAPQFEGICDQLLLRSCVGIEKLPGVTEIVIDVSGSMYGTPVSAKSDMNRALAACALGAIGREICKDARIYATAGNDYSGEHKTALVPSRHGMALVDAIYAMTRPLGGGGIFITPVCRYLTEKEGHVDRTIFITDEQDCARSNKADSPLLAKPNGTLNYLINVNVYKNGVSYGAPWLRIDGWSENVFTYIRECEKANLYQ